MTQGDLSNVMGGIGAPLTWQVPTQCLTKKKLSGGCFLLSAIGWIPHDDRKEEHLIGKWVP